MPDKNTAPEPQERRSELFNEEVSAKLDKAVHNRLAKLTGGMSPAAMPMAYMDWLAHLSMSPGKQAKLVEKAARDFFKIWAYSAQAPFNKDLQPVVVPDKTDFRWRAEGWNKFPYNVLSQSFLVTRDWWRAAMQGVPGVEAKDEAMVKFATETMVDMFSPTNSPLTNPEVHRITAEEKGANLWRGWMNFVSDMQKTAAGKKVEPDTSHSQVGKDVAITPGKVIFRNELIEVMQYEPTTKDVYKEPVLFIPAWIMKYYILDLKPDNSMYKYLVDQGHTVFTISWVNPDERHRDIGMHDYLHNAVLKAFDVVSSVVPDEKIHGVGYCLGGTILTIAAALMARNGDDRLASITIFAAQTDFSEPGELSLFISEDQLSFLEDQMSDKGYLTGEQMASTFAALRANDLIWARMIEEYLMGKKGSLNDLMAWNADATRMPYRMHSEYLRNLYLHNRLSKGSYVVDGKPVAIRDIKVPIFSVGTEKDHVAPWQSVYKINYLATSDDTTFVLTSGGHNAGIVSEPGHRGRRYKIKTLNMNETGYLDPESWVAQADSVSGSWWEPWNNWLNERSSDEKVAPPAMGSTQYPATIDAPGTYVLVR